MRYESITVPVALRMVRVSGISTGLLLVSSSVSAALWKKKKKVLWQLEREKPVILITGLVKAVAQVD